VEPRRSRAHGRVPARGARPALPKGAFAPLAPPTRYHRRRVAPGGRRALPAPPELRPAAGPYGRPQGYGGGSPRVGRVARCAGTRPWAPAPRCGGVAGCPALPRRHGKARAFAPSQAVSLPPGVAELPGAVSDVNDPSTQAAPSLLPLPDDPRVAHREGPARIPAAGMRRGSPPLWADRSAAEPGAARSGAARPPSRPASTPVTTPSALDPIPTHTNPRRAAQVSLPLGGPRGSGSRSARWTRGPRRRS
jgi:hypothetical protein